MADLKRQKLPPGRLWIVATPIGNLSDLSPRARETLESANGLLCEDTRRTRALVTALGLTLQEGARLERYDAHSTPAVVEKFVARLMAGESLAMVTDAGTPAVSDPGASLVMRARESGIVVAPVPGPSAVTALLSVSGFSSSCFAFHGFFPRGEREAKSELEKLRSGIHVWFESPHRMVEAMARIAELFPDAGVVAGKELTKLHERIFAGATLAVEQAVREEIAREGELGEWSVAVEVPAASDSKDSEKVWQEGSESSDWVKALRCMLDARISAPEAAKRVSQYFGVARKLVYDEATRLGDKKNFRRD